MTKQPVRLASIDAFRALTMFFMIFVNDSWTATNIPEWIDHVKGNVDGMGFADSIFPAFLFIVGLSLPIALDNRKSKGETFTNTIYHILTRSFALIAMGFYTMNLEEYNDKAALLPRPVWEVLLIIAFFLIWLDYPRDMKKVRQYILQGLGVAIMVVLSFLYAGKAGRHGGDAVIGLRPHWWGILGLIGWSYFLCALIYAFSMKRVIIPIIAFVFFLAFSTFEHLHWLGALDPIHKYVWIIGSGGEPALMMAGVLFSLLYKHLTEKNKVTTLGVGLFPALAVAMAALGFLLRPIGGISKIGDTPSWVCICIGISIAVFSIMIYLVDYRKKQNWFALIWPAGTSTLTCYLIPYVTDAIFYPGKDPRVPWHFLNNYSLPAYLKDGILGIIQLLLFSLVIILIGGFLEKRRIRLKI